MGNELFFFMTEDVSNWIAGIFTLFMFSLLYKENPFYRLAEHVYVGTSAAHGVIAAWNNNLKPRITNDIAQQGEWWMLLPIVMGLLIYFNVYRPYAWLARMPMAYWIGYNAAIGLSVRTVIPWFVDAMASMKPLVVFTNGAFNAFDSFSNLCFIISILGTIVVFFFTIEHTGVLGTASKIGRYGIMLGLGASFGNTVSSRISLLIGRFEFLLRDWLKLI
ncbi:MAG: hypothetical protein FWE76_09115 [Symbiobacteriaceae bacterium]|nr:hypothetical protein [Symbiobacteriaceae bacterium]